MNKQRKAAVAVAGTAACSGKSGPNGRAIGRVTYVHKYVRRSYVRRANQFHSFWLCVRACVKNERESGR